MPQPTKGSPAVGGKPEAALATPADFSGAEGSLFGKRVYPPVGSIMAFAGVFNDSPGEDWRPCWGQSLRQSDYEDLWKVIGTAWGRGDNPGTTFRLPDLRGYFLRGVASGSSVDPDRETRVGHDGGNPGDRVGSYQSGSTALPHKHFTTGNDLQPHRHGVEHNVKSEGVGNQADGGGDVGLSRVPSITVTDPTNFHQHDVESGGDAETRPVNAYVHWIIRVK